MSRKPNATSSMAEKELEKAEAQFDAFDKNVKDLTLDRMNQAPKQESELEMSHKDIQKSNDIYLKPKRALPPGVDPKTGKREIFNEKFRADYEFQKQYVQFVAENKELGSEGINDIWTKPFPGMECESWDVPVNKPVWGPRYLAEQIKRKCYHRLVMQEKVIQNGSEGQYYGQMVADTTVQRLDAHPVSQRKTLFMGSSGF